MASVDEIAIKLGIDAREFKAALKDADTNVAKLKKQSEGEFFGGIKSATKSLNDFKNLIGGSVLAGAVKGFFDLAIEGAKKSTDATDTNAAAVREFAQGLDDVKGIASTVAVTTVGAFNKLGSAIGDAINIGRSFIENGAQGFEKWAAAQDLIEAQTRAIAEQEAKFAEVRKKHGAEFLAITKELADIEKKSQDQKLKGLDVYETEANLEAKIAALRAKANKNEGENIDKRRLALEIARTQLALNEASLAASKARAAEQKKANDDEIKSMEEYAKAAEERRKDLSLSAEKEAELFALRKKSAEAAAAQGKTDLNIITLQNQQILAQMEIQKLRAKLTASLTPAEQAYLEKLEQESAEVAKQIAQKQQLLAASNNRSPVEAKLLEQLQAQAAALQSQIKGLTDRASVTSNFTEAEGVFLAQLEKQQVAIAAQIELLNDRARTPNTLTAAEQALLVPLQEQARTYDLLIAKLKERQGTGQSQTAEEVKYLDTLKASAGALVTQIEQMRTRATASAGLAENEGKLLANLEAESLSLQRQIEDFETRKNSSVGITEEEDRFLDSLIRGRTAIVDQIATMRERAGSAGQVATNEALLLTQLEGGLKTLLLQVGAMEQRKKTTEAQRNADAERLKTLEAGTAATEKQITAITKGGEVTRLNLDATKQMTQADKDRLGFLELLATKQRQQVELKEAEAALVKDSLNPALQAAYNQAVASLDVTEKQLIQKQKITLGQKEDVELLVLQSKAASELSLADRARLKELLAATEEKRRQLEIEYLMAKGVENLTSAEKARIVELTKQSEAYAKQIKAKEELVRVTTGAQVNAEEEVTSEYENQMRGLGRVITESERAALAASGTRVPAEQRVTVELQRQLDILNEQAAREAQIQKSRQTTVTNTGNIGTLDNAALNELNQTLKRQLSFLEASSLTQRQDTAEEAIIRAQLAAIQKELDLRRDFNRVSTLLESGKVQIQFGPETFARLNQLNNPDTLSRLDRNTQSIAVAIDKLANETARQNRIPPLIGPTTTR